MHQIHEVDTQECLDTRADACLVLLQVRSIPLRYGVPSLAALLFNHPIRGIIPVINRTPINANNDVDHYEALVERQVKSDKNYDTLRTYKSVLIGFIAVLQ